MGQRSETLWGKGKGIWQSPPFALYIIAVLVTACGVGEPPSLEQRAQGINKSLMCPVCPAENIDQSQVELARQMRAIVREKLEEGRSREQIIQFFVDRYGERVRMEPSTSGFNLVAWIMPPIGVAAGGLILFVVVRAMTKRRITPIHETLAPEDELIPYLDLVDRDLQSLEPGIQPSSPGNPSHDDMEDSQSRG